MGKADDGSHSAPTPPLVISSTIFRRLFVREFGGILIDDFYMNSVEALTITLKDCSLLLIIVVVIYVLVYVEDELVFRCSFTRITRCHVVWPI